MLTARIAFAPSLDLSFVPSNSMRNLSRVSCEKSFPFAFSSISMTLPTALRTPFPENLFPPSRSSAASFRPVLAPEGTIAAAEQEGEYISTSIVGCPRESRTSLAFIEPTFMVSLLFKYFIEFFFYSVKSFGNILPRIYNQFVWWFWSEFWRNGSFSFEEIYYFFIRQIIKFFTFLQFAFYHSNFFQQSEMEVDRLWFLFNLIG